MTIFHTHDYEFVLRREFDEFAQLMEVWLRTVLEELEVERGAQRAWFLRFSVYELTQPTTYFRKP